MRRLVIILFVLICSTAQAQTDVLALLETTKGNTSAETINTKLEGFINSIRCDKANDKDLLHKVFKKMNAVFLRKYTAYSHVDEVFTSGQYDCLTATAAYSLVLTRLNYKYEIIETNYHIFLIVETSEGNVLIETTDRFGGFVTGAGAIAARTGDYQANAFVAATGKHYLQYNFKLYQRIPAENLSGLLYFNQAVRAYNQRQLPESSVYLEKANRNYSSPRWEQFGIVLTRAITQSSLDEETKAACLSRLMEAVGRKEIAAMD